MNSLEQISKARTALAAAKDMPDILEIHDFAVAASAYAKAAKLGLQAQNEAASIKLDAERKAGQALKGIEREKGGDRRSGEFQRNHDDPIEKNDSKFKQVLDDNDISAAAATRWQSIASIPEEEYQEFKQETTEENKELTSNGALRLAQKIKRKDHHEALQDSPLPPNKYRIIYADPPWRYNDSGVITDSDNYGRAERHYPTMMISELCDLPIKDMAIDDSVLFLWATSPLLEDAFKVLNAWGFNYKTSFVWDKVGHNFGHYNSVRHEFLLVCTRGSCTPDNLKLFDSVQKHPKSSKHSEKPSAFREIIDTLYPHGARVELFARVESEGWETWGNE